MHTLASFMYIYLYIRYIRAWLQAHAQRKRRKPIRFQTVHSDKMWGRKLSESRRVGSKTNHGFQKWRQGAILAHQWPCARKHGPRNVLGRLLHCCAKRLAMQRFISTRMRSARKSHHFNGFLEWDDGTYFSSNQDQHGTGCITRCLHFRTKWTTMFGEIEIGVWWILNGNSRLIPEAWQMWGRILIGFIHHDCRWGPMQFMTATFQCQVQLSCVVLAWFLWILMLTGVSSECAWCSDRSGFHPWLQSGGMHLKDAMLI